MNISRKLNLAFGVLLFLPLLAALGLSYQMYSRKLKQEALAKLVANRRTAQLVIEHRLEAMKRLAVAYANDSGLKFLILEPEYYVQKLEKMMLEIAEEPQIDRALIGWQKDQTIRAQISFELGELALLAQAPIYDRKGRHRGTLQIHQSFRNSQLLDLLCRQTAPSAVTLKEGSIDGPAGVNVLPLLSSQGYPIAALILHHDPTPMLAARKNMLFILGAFGLAGILLILGLQRVTQRSIIVPLQRLQEAAENVQAGRFDLSLAAGADEIGLLAQAFTRMSASLQEHFEQYRELIKGTVNGAGVVQDGVVVFCNEAFLRLLRLSEQEVLGAPFERIFPQGLQSEWQRRECWLSCRESEILWHQRSAGLLTLQDMTARKTRELEQERERQQLREENARLRDAMRTRERFGRMIGKSLPMQQIYDLLPSTAQSDATVLITGETGTGKGLLAKTIHDLSARQRKPFIPVNCGSVPEQLFENEFFGHVKGAFTGAERTVNGYLKHAEGGTLFLDEVAELTVSMQIKFLQLLDGEGYSPIGSSVTHRPDIRIVAATNQDVEALMARGKLREDFYYRINVLPLRLAPLRQRKEDIPLLIDHFLAQCDLDDDEARPGLYERYQAYSWPGNVRELKNTIKRLQAGHAEFLRQSRSGRISASSLQESLEIYEKLLLETALQQSGGHRESTADLLGISESSLYRKMKKFGLT